MFLLTILLGILSISVTTVTPSFSNTNESIQNRELDNNKTIYLDLKKHSGLSNPYIHYNNGVDHIASLSIKDSAIYSFKLPKSVFSSAEYGFEICDENSYKSEWISGDSKLGESGYDYILLSSGISIDGYGFYGAKEDTPGATYKTQRVWLNNDNQYFYEGGYINAIGYEYEETYHIIKMSKVTSERDYYYADIPYQLSSVHFLRVSQESNNFVIDMDTNIFTLAFGVCYSVATSSVDDFRNISILTVQNANVELIAHVVEAYLTYGKSPSNGTIQITVQYLFKTWFRYKSATKDQMKDKKILDYTGYADNHNSYEGLTKNAWFSVNEKWNAMCSQAGIDPNTGEVRTAFLNLDARTWKIIGIVGGSIALVIGGATFLFIYKKKKRNG